MSNNQGIFQAVSGSPPVSPSAPVGQGEAAQSPFAAVERSPFAVVDEGNGAPPVEPGKPARLPDKRPKTESPFQLADEPGALGFEPAAAAPQHEPAPAASPFALAGVVAQPPQGFANPGHQASSSFGGWTQPQSALSEPNSPVPAAFASAPVVPSTPAPPVSMPASPAASMPAPTSAPMVEAEGDSSSIRQIELRAIFGVDREMSHEEILQRVRALPGIRHVARLDAVHMGAFDGLKQVLAGLGFGAGGLRIYCGSSPVEFIREGQVILAAQTDGGFAPGVRETLIIVARELGK